ncbi:MAG: peptidylprolyl isomerase, partial [Anaerolineae bacterium]|nr:peptidylprolyl isomerase [Anaerolineae bacterium]
ALIKRLVDAFPEQVRIVYRHFPLKSIHDKALLSAEAAEAAGAQGKYWDMHDLLYERQSEWSGLGQAKAIEKFTDYANEIGLDGDQFAQALNEGTYRDRAEQGYNEAAQLGLPGTPTLFLNGQYYDGPRSDFVLSGLIKLYNYQGPQYTASPPMTIDPSEAYFATVKTNKGTFCIELYAEQAPHTVNNFVFLAEQGFYDGAPFHRVIAGFMAQTGDPTGSGFGGPGYRFDDEINPDLKHDGPGVVSMANAGANTNGSQFFITYQAVSDLDGSYSIFGQVIEGMETVEQITPRDPQQNPYTLADMIETIAISDTCGR